MNILAKFQNIPRSIWLNYHGLALSEVLHHYQAFQDIQKKPINEILDIQWQRLQQLLRQAYDKVAYYRKTFDKYGLTPHSVKTPEDFQKPPLLTRNIIQEQGENLLASNYRGARLIDAASGGSTGQPVSLVKDPTNKAVDKATTCGYHEWMGWKIEDPAMRLWGSLDPLTIRRRLYHWRSKICMRELRRNVHRMEKHVMHDIADCLRKFQPKILIGYTNAIYTFAKFWQEENRPKPGLLGVVTTAEMLFPYQHELIEKAFGCRVFNRYASQEVGELAGEC